MLKTKNQKNLGITLIEIIIAVSVGSLLIIAVSNILLQIFDGSRQNLLALSNIDQSTLIAKKFTNEIRNTTFGADGSYPINLADENQLIFYSNVSNLSNSIRIRYYLLDKKLYKGVIVASGNPLSYNLSSEKISIVQSDVVNNENPIFNYYDGNYNGTGDSMPQPVNINNIKYIKINLEILKQTQSNSQSSFFVSAGGSIRNLKTNLGE